MSQIPTAGSPKKDTKLLLRVLHLDDDPFELERVQTALEKHALDCTFAVTSVSTVADFQSKLASGLRPDVVILDIHIGEAAPTGIELADLCRATTPNAVILMCSTADDVATITECLSSEADDFISKQSDRGELSLRVFNSYRLAKLRRGDGTSSSTPASKGKPVGATLEHISRRVPLIIDSAISAVFIRGASGTGKEVVADLFGAALPSGVPFVKVNCGAIAPTLLESELFGHVKGAFTGATSDKRGLLEAASGGWIFLDEVATLSPSAQVALLRVLENQEVLRVGSTKPVSLQLRVLSATNEPLDKLVSAGRFRADLWQRLQEAEIVLPPLKDRPGEMRPLIEHFCRTMAGGPYQISQPALEVLASASWQQGNIRELRNCLRAMTELHVNKLLTPLAIPERIWDELGDKPAAGATTTPAPAAPAAEVETVTPAGSLVLPWDQSEAQNFEYMSDLLLLGMTRQLAAASGRLSLRNLAQQIGISRSTLSARLKALVHRNMIQLPELSRLVGISET